ncbi:MAG: glycosyltransferase family 87 protein [Candidatus Omnitrophota bacterium]|nr:glycosyltransferase family 87 protein [Candidatus Omnitrophota bacterium]MDZ4242537.1 glycosyltransferase family 87 protein [Candidatus Omnitrophota bacterium]
MNDSYRKFCLLVIISMVAAQFLLMKGADLMPQYKREYQTFRFPPSRKDFHINYHASRALMSGGDIYFVHKEKDCPNREWYNSPFLAYAFAPFSLLPEIPAYMLWITLLLAVTVFSYWLFSRFFENKPLFWAVTLVITAFSYPLKFAQERGTVDHLIYLLVVLMFFSYAVKRRAWVTGVLLSAATLMKLYPGIFILYFAVKREWKVLTWSLVSFAGLVLLTGWGGTYGTFIQKMTGVVTHGTQIWTGNHSLVSCLNLTVGAGVMQGIIPKSFEEKSFLALVCALILTVLYWWAIKALLRARVRTTRVIALEFSLLLSLATVTSPTSHDYNLVLLMFATMALMYHYQELWRRRPWSWKDVPGIVVFIVSTALLYTAPVLDIAALLNGAHNGKELRFYFLENDFWPVMGYFFLLYAILVNEQRPEDVRPASEGEKPNA